MKIRQIAGILFFGVIFIKIEDFVNYFGIGCTILGCSLISLIKIFESYIELPCSSSLYREIKQHHLQFIWIGKNIDKYIRFLRLHTILCIALLIGAIVTTFALIVGDSSDVVYQIFLPIVLIAGVLAEYSEKTKSGEQL